MAALPLDPGSGAKGIDRAYPGLFRTNKQSIVQRQTSRETRIHARSFDFKQKVGSARVRFGCFNRGAGSVSSVKATDIAKLDQATKWDSATPDLEHALNTFLVEHGEFTTMSSMNGLMSYAKFVSYDTSE